jgi:thiamine kinase-like enzyme
MQEEIAAALARIPALAGADLRAARATRLGGLTNANWLVELAGGRYVLRIPGKGTGDYIDRAAEERAARAAAAVGVNAEVLHFDAADGVQLCRFVEGAKTMSPEAFEDEGAIRRAAVALRTVHREAEPFAKEFALFPMIDAYRELLARRAATLPEGYGDVVREAEAVRAALAAHPAALAPCHCDPLCENFLDTGARMVVVDWEYAGNNDPMWDLGDLAVEAGFGAEQEAILLDAYFDGAVPPAAAGRVVLYKAMCDLLWTLWGVIQHTDGNPADDFWAYAVNRFERCKRLMATPTFRASLAAVRNG